MSGLHHPRPSGPEDYLTHAPRVKGHAFRDLGFTWSSEQILLYRGCCECGLEWERETLSGVKRLHRQHKLEIAPPYSGGIPL